MKIKWEASDIIVGRRVGKPGREEQWMIGYVQGENSQSFALISLVDGAVVFKSSADELARHLNVCAEIPAELLPRLNKDSQ